MKKLRKNFSLKQLRNFKKVKKYIWRFDFVGRHYQLKKITELMFYK